MLYANALFRTKEHEFSFGPLWGLQLGEYDRSAKKTDGRGPKTWKVVLPAPRKVRHLSGAHGELYLARTKSGLARISDRAGSDDGVVLTTKAVSGGKVGKIFRLKSGADIDVISRGTDRRGNREIAAAIPPGGEAWFRIQKPGDRLSGQVIHWPPNGIRVREVRLEDLAAYLGQIWGPPPFSLLWGAAFVEEEWEEVK